MCPEFLLFVVHAISSSFAPGHHHIFVLHHGNFLLHEVAAVVPPDAYEGHGLVIRVVSIGRRAMQGFESEAATESTLFCVQKEMARLGSKSC